MKRIKNKKGVVWILAGQRFEIDQIFDIPDADLISIWTKRADVLQAITNGEFTMFNGSVELTDPVTAINFLLDIQPTDNEGSPVFSPKTNSVGWTFKKVGIDFVTCEPDSMVYRNHEGTILNILTMKCYNAANELLITQPDRDIYCVKTVVDIMQQHDIELVCGGYKTLSPVNTGRLWFVVAPDFPAPLGTKSLAENIAMKFELDFNCDGRNRKKLLYNDGIGSNKLRGIITHAAGEKFDCQFILEEFVP